MKKLKPLQILKSYGATQLSLIKDLDQGHYLVEKKIIVSIEVQKKLFANEIHIHQQLDHRYIIKFIRQVGEDAFLMEYAPNGSIEDLLKRNPREFLSRRQVQQLLMSIDYLHNLGYVHNDIKTSNILLDNEKRIKLSDFAFAGKIGETFFEDFPDYFMVGTDKYRPIMKKKSKINCVQNDLYSIGIVLFRAFSNDGNLESPDVALIEDETIRYIVQNCLNEKFKSASEILDVLNSSK